MAAGIRLLGSLSDSLFGLESAYPAGVTRVTPFSRIAAAQPHRFTAAGQVSRHA
jgi:hypothetical protein